MTKALYAGTFDPFSNGHLDIVKRSLSFCDNLIIGIGDNSAKKTLLSAEVRLDLTNRVLDDEFKVGRERIFVSIFSGLLVDFAKMMSVNILVRGIRSVSDFEYEINLANINKTLDPSIETVFLPTSPTLSVVSSSMVKEILKYKGDVSPFVHPFIRQHLVNLK